MKNQSSVQVTKDYAVKSLQACTVSREVDGGVAWTDQGLVICIEDLEPYMT